MSKSKPFDFTNFLVPNKAGLPPSPRREKETTLSPHAGPSGSNKQSPSDQQGIVPVKPSAPQPAGTGKWHSLKHHKGAALIEHVKAAHPSYTDFMVNAVVHQIEKQQAEDEEAERQAYLKERQRRFELKVSRMQGQLKVPSVTNADGAAQSMWRSRVWLMDNAPEALERATAMFSRAMGLVQHERIGFADEVSAQREEALKRRIEEKERRTAPLAIEKPVEHTNKAKAMGSMSPISRVQGRKQAIDKKTANGAQQLLQRTEEGVLTASRNAEQRILDEHLGAKHRNLDIYNKLFQTRDGQEATDAAKAERVVHRAARRQAQREQHESIATQPPHPLPSHQPLFGVGGANAGGEFGSTSLSHAGHHGESSFYPHSHNEASMSLQWSPSGVASRSGIAPGVGSGRITASPSGGNFLPPSPRAQPATGPPVSKPVALLMASEAIARGKLTATALSFLKSLAKECQTIANAHHAAASRGHLTGLRTYNRDQRVSKKTDFELKLAVEQEALKLQGHKEAQQAANERAAAIRERTAAMSRDKNIARQLRAEQLRKEQQEREATDDAFGHLIPNEEQTPKTAKAASQPTTGSTKHVTIATSSPIIVKGDALPPSSPKAVPHDEFPPAAPGGGGGGVDSLGESSNSAYPQEGALIADINPKIAEMLRKVTGFEKLDESQVEATRVKSGTLYEVTRKVKENQQPKADAAYIRRVANQQAEWSQLNAKVNAKVSAPVPLVNYGAMHAISAQLTAKVAIRGRPATKEDARAMNVQSARAPQQAPLKAMDGASSARVPRPPPPQVPVVVHQSPSPSYDPAAEPPPFAFAPRFNSSALPQPHGASPPRAYSLTASNAYSHTTAQSLPVKKSSVSTQLGQPSPRLEKLTQPNPAPRASVSNTDVKQLVALEGRSGALGGVVDRTHTHNEQVSTKHQQWREKLKEGADSNTFGESKGKVEAASTRKGQTLNERAQVAGVMGSHRQAPEFSPKEARIKENLDRRQERKDQKKARFKLANSELGQGLRED